MKHAYLIVAHNNFETLKKLISLLDDENNNIFILIDKKVKIPCCHNIYKAVKHSKIKIVDPMYINWAGSSQIKGTLHLLEEAIKEKCDYYHLLSGNDLPIKSKQYIYRYFEKHKGYEFIEYEPRNYEFAKYKANYYHFFVDNKLYRKNKVIKIFNHVLVKLQSKMKISREKEVLFHGSAWFSITNECAKYVLSKKEEICNRYKYTLACDEVFLQTLIYASPFKDKIRFMEQGNKGNLRYIDWKRRKGNSPYTFVSSDFKNLLEAGEDLLFARKFDESLDEHIINNIVQYLKEEKEN